MVLMTSHQQANKYGIPKSTLHGWIYPNGKLNNKPLPMPDNTELVVAKLTELNDKIDKLIKAWEIK